MAMSGALCPAATDAGGTSSGVCLCAQVYGVPIGGTLVRQRWTTDGSGSTYLWGYLDSAYKRAPAACLHAVAMCACRHVCPARQACGFQIKQALLGQPASLVKLYSACILAGSITNPTP